MPYTAVVIDATQTEEDRAFSEKANLLGRKIHEAVKEASGDITDASMLITALTRVTASFILGCEGNEVSHSSLCCAIHEMLHAQINEFYSAKSAPRH